MQQNLYFSYTMWQLKVLSIDCPNAQCRMTACVWRYCFYCSHFMTSMQVRTLINHMLAAALFPFPEPQTILDGKYNVHQNIG